MMLNVHDRQETNDLTLQAISDSDFLGMLKKKDIHG